ALAARGAGFQPARAGRQGANLPHARGRPVPAVERGGTQEKTPQRNPPPAASRPPPGHYQCTHATHAQTFTARGRVNPKDLSPAEQRALTDWDRRLDTQPDTGHLESLVPELPPPGSSLRPLVLVRLVRAHMLRAAGQGWPPAVAAYLQRFPELKDD